MQHESNVVLRHELGGEGDGLITGNSGNQTARLQRTVSGAAASPGG